MAVICVTSSKKEGFIVENSMQKRYGLFTAISMVVGIVIGSCIFFKATKVPVSYTHRVIFLL